MKRQQDRESPPRNRRSRSRYSAHDDSDRERLSPDINCMNIRRQGSGKRDRDFLDANHSFDIDRLERRRSSPVREMSNHYNNHQMHGRGGQQEAEYRTICLRLNLPDEYLDEEIKERLFRDFKKFGEFNIRIVGSGEYRLGYLNFRFPGDARDAKLARQGKYSMFDRLMRIDPVYTNKSKQYEHSGNGGFRGGDDRTRMHNMDHNRRDGGYGMSRNQGPVRNQDTQFREERTRYSGSDDGNRDVNKEKFPYHLDHVDPEDDAKATRTLFIGNLDLNIEDAELREIFERYGPIEDIDIKRPLKGQGNAYAFVKYYNLDMAHRAKVEMSGQYIGRFQCKIGYGKVTPTNCLWVGGLGPWVRPEKLEAEFDRFGAIHRIEWPQGKPYAYVLYDSIDAATAACQQMRGFPLGGNSRRIRVDFSDINHITTGQSMTPPRTRDYSYGDQPRGGKDQSYWQGREFESGSNGRKSRDQWDNRGEDFANKSQDGRRDFDRMSESSDRRRQQGRTSFEEGEYPRGRFQSTPSRSTHGEDFHRDPSPKRRRTASPAPVPPPYPREPEEVERTEGNGLVPNVDHVNSVVELAHVLPVVWSGSLVLKNSAFPAKMHLVSGDVTIVDNLMRDPTTTEPPVLRITQRLRLDQPKLEEVGRRVSGSGGHSVLLAMPGSNQEDPSSNIQYRPLKNLVSYLKQKDAAGVISLPPNPVKDTNNVGVLHAFPPCEFGQEFLCKRAPRLGAKPATEDHLIIVVVRGAT